MASSSPTISIFIISSLLLLSSTFSNAKTSPKPKAFIFPVKKDDATNQYYTTVEIGSNTTTLNVVVDLGGKFLWFNWPDYASAADSYRPLLCGTKQCKLVIGAVCTFCIQSLLMPGCTNNTCSIDALNPFSGTRGYSSLGLDVLRAYSTGGTTQYKLNNFPFQFSDPELRKGLATTTVGLVGLGRTKISLPAQLSSAFKIREKIALCIPSSGTNGNMIIGEVAYKTPFQKISDSIITTPLVRNPVSTFGNDQVGDLAVEYFIGVKSIRVGEIALALNNTLLSINKKSGEGGTSIRTVRAYTSMHRSIYKALVEEFVKAAGAKKIKRVAAVAPFTACFDSGTISSTKTGPDVPTVDLILQNKKVYWRFYGSNSMVGVSEGVMCLAFVEGQPNLVGPTTSIVVGGHQLENHLLELDVSASKLGFTSSLLLHDTTCSLFGAA